MWLEVSGYCTKGGPKLLLVGYEWVYSATIFVLSSFERAQDEPKWLNSHWAVHVWMKYNKITPLIFFLEVTILVSDILGHFSIIVFLNSSSVMARRMVCTAASSFCYILNLLPFNCFFKHGKSQKSSGTRSGLYGGCSKTLMNSLTRRVCIAVEVWRCALSWWRIHLSCKS